MQAHDNTTTTAADLPINDHYDTTTLAREHLEHAEALFTAVMRLSEAGTSIHHLARLGSLTTREAADGFNEQAQVIDAREAAQ